MNTTAGWPGLVGASFASVLWLSVSLASGSNSATKFGNKPGGKPSSRLQSKNSSIKDYGLKNYLRASVSLPHSEVHPWKLIASLPYNCHFQPCVTLISEAGKEIVLKSTNPLVEYLTKPEVRTTSSGIQTIEAKNWVSGEGAMYLIPAGVTVKSIRYRETGYDTTFAGSFVCNDSDFNTLWTKAARTAYICMRDHFYDCPDRERVGFWGDGTPELDQCFYIFDERSHQLARDLVRRKLEPKFYPGQHLEFLGDYGLWFYYLQTGDLDSIRAVYDQTKTFLFDTYKFGNAHTWFDWGKENKDTAVIETCFMYNCLGTLRKMAIATGHDRDLPEIDKRLQAISSTFDSLYWKNGFYKSNQVPEPDDRANAMVINVGLASPDKFEAIDRNVLSTKTYSSCFFDRWVFEAYCKMGKPNKALLRMATRYRTMIPAKFTTLWEHYDRWWASYIDAFDDGSSLNHGWNPPALVLSKDICGIQPISAGWQTFAVLPQEGFLQSMKVAVPTVKGPVKVEIQKTDRSYDLSVQPPELTTALVGIPKAAFQKLDSISANGRVVWNGKFIGGSSGIEWDGETTDYIKFRIGSRNWKFVGKGKIITGSPKPLPKKLRKEVALDRRGWTFETSAPKGEYLFTDQKIAIDVSGENVLDGDAWTGWRDMSQTQHPGQWVQVDMKTSNTFDKVVLDNTWALWDSPEHYEVKVSQDGVNWGQVIASGHGELGITTINFPKQNARFIRINQTGTNPKYHWSIYELDVFRGSP